MTVEDIKNILNNAIEALNEYDDMDEVDLQSNYGGMDNFIYVDGVRERGFVDLDDIGYHCHKNEND
ncbi:hypothetical protein SAMN05720470_10114 [Fibrobacter sp. UWOV1]|uniref:hypothetical protein n=1 Tax=Fibrobacter sp. UWOV1 TaxID=1896215 RepID=UPI00091939EF|nr:hypothetical protein [Fibrobacter sp. UWOV1]SHK27516.1 hypothetical protein SAMN05720470_10114 [Fibrobacter sp. UWOV1]